MARFQCFDTHGTKQKPVEQTATLTYKYKDLMNRDYSHYLKFSTGKEEGHAIYNCTLELSNKITNLKID